MNDREINRLNAIVAIGTIALALAIAAGVIAGVWAVAQHLWGA